MVNHDRVTAIDSGSLDYRLDPFVTICCKTLLASSILPLKKSTATAYMEPNFIAIASLPRM